ncbi:MAG: prephenate dehydrogenase/arogenate dehydrogenase family protein [Methylococcales bacterium]|nr:prephenate dehydrogenase/arogenate dehydrogenase family protein [Methylococcales bacterium]
MFNKLCIIGVGLIGGSIAKSARQKKLAKTIVGFGRPEDFENLKHAQKLKIIDHYYTDIQLAVENANCVIIATPVGSFERIFKQLKPHWSKETIYTDAGSTKGSVIKAAQTVFGFVPTNFVPAHPIAGAEKSGAEAAQIELYKNKRLIITPLKETNKKALSTIQTFWEAIGSYVSFMDIKHHDTVLGATSHLPHILAYALTDLLGQKNETIEIFKYAAGGFNDFTRIASSDPTMWLDICMANKDEIIPLLFEFRHKLEQIEIMLQDNKTHDLFETFSYAQNSRQQFLDQQK